MIIERSLVVIERSSIRPKFRDVKRREVNELPELPFALPDLLFRLLCRGDIHHRPDKFYEVARLVQDRMSDSMEVLDGSAGKNNAVVRLVVCFLDFGSFEKFPNALSVLGVISAKPKFNGRRILIGLDAEYSKDLR